MSGWYEDGSEEQAQAERRWAAQNRAIADAADTTQRTIVLVALDWDTLKRLFPQQIDEFYAVGYGRVEVCMRKAAEIELVAMAPGGAAHLRLKEYKP
jgi:hypothetical protein